MLTKKKDVYETPIMNRGSIIITLVVTMLVFSVLIAAMYSLTSSSIFGQLSTASTTKATYIAKSGYNYLASQYKHEASELNKNLALADDLHDKTFQLLNNDGSFHLNVKPYYLISQQRLTITNANGLTLTVRFPGDVVYTIPASGTMAVYTGSGTTGYRRFYYSSVTTLGTNNYRLNLSTTNPPDGQPIEVYIGTSILRVLTTPAYNQTVSNGGNLTLTAGTGNILPARFGFFEIPRLDTARPYVFTYDRRTVDTLYDIRDASDPSRTFSYTLNAADNRMIYVHTSAEITSTGTLSVFPLSLGPTVSNTFSRMAILGYKPGGNSDNVSDVISGVDSWVVIGTGVGIDTTNQQIQLGRSTYNTAGVVWYAGDADAANCATGLCDFGLGIRAYFVFQDTTGSSSSGDGFMFMFMNGILNDTTERGGTPSGSGMGELMGYAGPGNSADGLGLQSPKISVEFDRYNNAGLSGTPAGAGCSNGRNDATGNHMALMFWGNNTAGTCSGGINDGLLAASFDDNVHNAGTAGSATVPINSYSGTPSPACDTDPTQAVCGYSAQTFSNTSARPVRVEITRAATPNGNGNYEYNMKVWIWTTACSGAGCDDVSVAFTASTPQINHTIELTPTLHGYYHKIFFGFTQGTGAATQNILISSFSVYFIPY